MAEPTGPLLGRLVSVQVALPEPAFRQGSEWVVSAFRKRPVDGPVPVGPEGLEGDGHGNPNSHGGIRKAVYAYPLPHYSFWRRERPELEFPPGAFGENLTVEGPSEGEVRPGDLLSVGDIELEVTQPRFPCFKLGLRFERPSMVEEFARAGRSGYYLSVRRGGTIRAGDEIRSSGQGPPGPSIEEIFRARVDDE